MNLKRNMSKLTKPEFLTKLNDTFSECYLLAEKKNSDYADNDNPFKNFEMSTQVGVTPPRAILVRISDKLSRVSNLLDKPASVADESISDTLNDIINYTAILKVYLNERQ